MDAQHLLIHSLETFATADGPGVRFVLFVQGCDVGCMYCHNPDTWSHLSGTSISIAELTKEIEPFVTVYQQSGGGITVSGGEPLLQAEAITVLFQSLKASWGLHTALDTSGYGLSRLGTAQTKITTELLAVTDLVILDLKAMNESLHQRLTVQSNQDIIGFGNLVANQGIPIIVRHVLIPDWTDSTEDLQAIGQQIARWQKQTSVSFELLPFHQLGQEKWRQLGWNYPLEKQLPPTKEALTHAQAVISNAILASKNANDSFR